MTSINCRTLAEHFKIVNLAGAVLANPLRFVDGHGQCPTGPGVGIAWNEEAVGRFAV